MSDDDFNKNRGDGYGAPDTGNIVPLPTLAERDAMRREKERMEAKHAPGQDASAPLINLPPLTKITLGIFIAAHLLIHVALPLPQMEWVFTHLGFVPGRFTGALDFSAIALVSPLTHIFIHGSWLHLGMNTVMMAAFGSGIERWMGPKRMALFFLLCGLCGAALHFALNVDSPYPVIGASGALSGLFAAAILMLNRGRAEMGGRFGMLPFILLWIGITVGFGMMGSPDGSAIAWAAHLGGFLGGFVILKLMRI